MIEKMEGAKKKKVNHCSLTYSLFVFLFFKWMSQGASGGGGEKTPHVAPEQQVTHPLCNTMVFIAAINWV